MPAIIAIKTAETADERDRIFRFRYDVYVEEMGKKPSVADHRNRVICDELDDGAHLFYAEADGELVGTLRLNLRGHGTFPDFWEKVYGIETFAVDFAGRISMTSRMMVAKEWRGSLVSGALLSAVYNANRGLGSKFDFCNCAPSLLEFYEQIGYRRFTTGFLDEDNGYRVPLVGLVRDLEHLKQVRSPLYRTVRGLEHEPETGDWFRRTFPLYATAGTARSLSPEAFWMELSSHLAAPPAECVSLFEGLTAEELSGFLRSGAVLTLHPGDKIIRQGDVGDEMYVILSGVAEATCRKGTQDYSLAIMTKGEIFGEVAFVSSAVRSADVTALTDMQVLIISRGFFTRAMRKQPDVSAKVLLNLSLLLAKRLRVRTDSWLDAVTNEADV